MTNAATVRKTRRERPEDGGIVWREPFNAFECYGCGEFEEVRSAAKRTPDKLAELRELLVLDHTECWEFDDPTMARDARKYRSERKRRALLDGAEMLVDAEKRVQNARGCWEREHKRHLETEARAELAEKSLAEVRGKLSAVWDEARAAEAKCDALENAQTAAGLSAAEVERLALLAMAAGKLAGECAKVVLYGWGSPSPCTGRPAYVDVERGLGRVQALAELMAGAGDVRGGDVRAYQAKSRELIGERATRQ